MAPDFHFKDLNYEGQKLLFYSGFAAFTVLGFLMGFSLIMGVKYVWNVSVPQFQVLLGCIMSTSITLLQELKLLMEKWTILQTTKNNLRLNSKMD